MTDYELGVLFIVIGVVIIATGNPAGAAFVGPGLYWVLTAKEN